MQKLSRPRNFRTALTNDEPLVVAAVSWVEDAGSPEENMEVSIVFVADVPIFGWVYIIVYIQYTHDIRIHFFACDASIPIFGVLTYPSITLHAWFYPHSLLDDIPTFDQPFAIPKAMLRVLNVMRMNDSIKEALRHWIWSPNVGSNLGFGDEATAGYNMV